MSNDQIKETDKPVENPPKKDAAAHTENQQQLRDFQKSKQGGTTETGKPVEHQSNALVPKAQVHPNGTIDFSAGTTGDGVKSPLLDQLAQRNERGNERNTNGETQREVARGNEGSDATRDGKGGRLMSEAELKATKDAVDRELGEWQPSAEKLANLIARRPENQRKQFIAYYEKATGASIDSKIDAGLATPIYEEHKNLDVEFTNTRPTDKAGAERLKYELHRPEPKSVTAGKLDMLVYDAAHGKANDIALGEAVRDLVRPLTPQQLQTELGGTSANPPAGSLMARMMDKNSGLNEDTRKAVAIYANGQNENGRRPEDTIALANIAIKSGNQRLFIESMNDATDKGRSAFRESKDGGGLSGVERAHDTFSPLTVFHKPVIKNPLIDEALNWGNRSFFQAVRESRGLLGHDFNDIYFNAENLPAARKSEYKDGKKLAESGNVDVSKLDEHSKKSLEFYHLIHDESLSKLGVYANIGGFKQAHIAAVEEHILYPGSTLFTRLADQSRATIPGGGPGMEHELNTMTDRELNYMRHDAAYRKQAETVLDKSLTPADAARLKGLLAQKLGAPQAPLDIAVGGSASPIDRLKAISNASDEDLAHYRSGEANKWKGALFTTPEQRQDKSKAQIIDGAVDDGANGTAKDALKLARKQILEGRKPDAEIAAATLPKEESNLRSVLDNLDHELAKPGSTLSQKLNDKDHPEYAEQFRANLLAQISEKDYQKFVTPMVEQHHRLNMQDRVGMYKENEKGQMFDDFAHRSAQERKELAAALHDEKGVTPLGKALNEKLLPEERKLLSNELRDVEKHNGEIAPEQRTREVVLGIRKDAGALNALVGMMNANEKQQLTDNYLSTYGGLALAQLQNMSGTDPVRQDLVAKLTDHITSSESTFVRHNAARTLEQNGNVSIKLFDTIGTGSVSTATQVNFDEVNQRRKENFGGQPLSESESANADKRALEAVRNLHNMKDAESEKVVNVLATVGALAATPITGGASGLALLARGGMYVGTSAAIEVYAKEQMMGGNYDNGSGDFARYLAANTFSVAGTKIVSALNGIKKAGGAVGAEVNVEAIAANAHKLPSVEIGTVVKPIVGALTTYPTAVVNHLVKDDNRDLSAILGNAMDDTLSSSTKSLIIGRFPKAMTSSLSHTETWLKVPTRVI